MTSNHIISLENDFNDFSKLTKFLKEFGENNSIDPKSIFQINLSLEEIFNNILLYGSKDKSIEISFKFELKNNTLIVIIEDDAAKFNPLKVAEPDRTSSLRDREVGGLGIFLFRSLMDRVIYKRDKNKNILIIEKNLIIKTDQKKGV